MVIKYVFLPLDAGLN